MTRQRKREEFFVKIVAEGLPLDIARLIARHAHTIQRLNEAECNGDYPCDNGERRVDFCKLCESGYVPHFMKQGVCPNCRAQKRIEAILAHYPNFKAKFQGDPRGACVKLVVPSGHTDDWGREGICVP